MIIGAGISGCAAAQELQKNGIDYLLLEKNVDPGGITRSFSIGEAHFDYTGHFLSLNRCKNPAELPYVKQKEEDWQIVQRNSAVYFRGVIVPAPLQYNLFALPEKLKKRCIEDFRNRMESARPKSFKEYLLSGFGQGMCDIFLFPYNEKQMAISLDRLSIDSANRFFPHPDNERIESGYTQGKDGEPVGYNSYFWYPKKHGIGLLAKGLAQDLKNIHLCCAVEKIELAKKLAHTSCGKVHYRYLMTSMPLKQFCEISDDSKLQNLAKSLSHNRVLCLNILKKGALHKALNGCHWVYIPDKQLLFYRLGIYSHLPSSFVSSSHTSIFVEVAFKYNVGLPSLSNLLNRVFFALEKLTWVSRKDCLVISANWIDCGYVHFTHLRQKNLPQIFNFLQYHDVYPIGRYGLWDYMTMEESIFSGIDVAKKLTQKN